MNKESKRRYRQKGRRSEGTYLGIPHYVTNSIEFGDLDGWACKLLIQLAAQYNGRNNGDFSCAYSVMKAKGWRSKATLQGARDELVKRRWIRVTRHGNRRLCALYAVTWLPIDACEGKGLEVGPIQSASNEWQWSKQQKEGAQC